MDSSSIRPSQAEIEISEPVEGPPAPDGDDRDLALTTGGRLARNTLWNLTGYLGPLVIAVLVVPLLIRHLGTAKYGILTIAWSVVGYFGIFDMGLSNALTKFIAERVGQDSEDEIEAIFQTGFILLVASSICGAIGLAIISRPLAFRWLNIPLALRPDAHRVFLIFALALPFVVSVACFRGTLCAYQRFDIMNKIQVATGICSFGSPAVMLLFSNRLVPIVAAIALCRVGSWLAYLYFCTRVLPSFDFTWRARRALVRPLVTFGGWISVCNVTDPLFLYSDRFILASLVSVSAVAYYATPFDVIVRLWAIPDALNSALFPLYAAGLRNNSTRVITLFEKAGHYIFPLTFAPILFVVLFANDILGLWINWSFAAHSAVVLAWLAVGVLFSSMARVPWTLLSAYRPDLPAKLVTFEAPIYVTLLYFMIGHYGLIGAAMAWTVRTGFNCSMLHVMTFITMPGSARAAKKNCALLTMAILVLIAAAFVPPGIAVRGLYWFFAFTACMSVTWLFVMSAEERAELKPAMLIG
jgi:O-antigen/teichoic acid export membrane protein